MKTFRLLPFLFFLSAPFFAIAQNYLRVADPDAWGAPSSNLPDWYDDYDHGVFEELRIVATPKGIFTEIEVFATITHSPGAWVWLGDFEIIWQFDLPQNVIVHDAWLWVGQDIIKADLIDFWTALETYTGIVDYNEDPLFFYQLADKRYEVRVYPLPQGSSRRLKLSFLVPAEWDAASVTQHLLQPMFQSTDYPPDMVEIAVPVDANWGSPSLLLGNSSTEMMDTITGGSGNLLHYVEVDGEAFTEADVAQLRFQAPFNEPNRTFTSVYNEGGDKFYQLVHIPDWEAEVQQAGAKKSLILLDYDSTKSSLDKTQLLAELQAVLGAHFTPADAVNVAVSTANGIRFLSDAWWGFDDLAFPDTLAGLLGEMGASDLEALLSEGFGWAQAQGDASGVFLLAASEDYFYPPIAEDVFAGISASIPAGIPLTLLDFQDENVSMIFYDNQEFHGNGYFFQLLQNSLAQPNLVVLRESTASFPEVCGSLFPAFQFPSGTMDFVTNMEGGISYQQYNIGSSEVSPAQRGAIMQTGRYLGSFPMNIHAGLIGEDGQFWVLNETVAFDSPVPGDTLMREIWYGPYLKKLESTIGSEDDRQFIIETSKAERILTGLTAFLALEPSLGGEPCIDCLFNDGGGSIIGTTEKFDGSRAALVVTPNPASDLATILLTYPVALTPGDWEAAIYNTDGSVVALLGGPAVLNGQLRWQWKIGEGHEGLYFVKAWSKHGELMAKLVVVR